MNQMIETESSVPNQPSAWRSVGQSLAATAAGYVAGMLTLTAWALLIGDSTEYLGLGLVIAGWCIASVVVPCWLIAVLPISLKLPANSRLWRPGPASALGALVGAILIVAAVTVMNLLQLRNDYTGLVLLVPIAVIIGATTGLTNALLRRN